MPGSTITRYWFASGRPDQGRRYLELLEEKMLALSSDPGGGPQVRASRAEVGAGQRVALTKEQALARIRT